MGAMSAPHACNTPYGPTCWCETGREQVDAMKWSIYKWKCRHNYRDGCRPIWMAAPPDIDGFSYEFDTWPEALAFVSRAIHEQKIRFDPAQPSRPWPRESDESLPGWDRWVR